MKGSYGGGAPMSAVRLAPKSASKKRRKRRKPLVSVVEVTRRELAQMSRAERLEIARAAQEASPSTVKKVTIVSSSGRVKPED